MSEERTEPASAKKLREARLRGEVSKSRDLTAAAVFLGVLTGLVAAAPAFFGAFSAFIVRIAKVAGDPAPDPHVSAGFLFDARDVVVQATGPALLAGAVLAFVVGFVQVGGVWAPKAVAADITRLNPVKGIKNIFNRSRLYELAKSLLMTLALGWMTWSFLRQASHQIFSLTRAPSASILAQVGELFQSWGMRTAAIVFAVGVLDYFYQRARFLREQRMTKEEVKREHRESEGDPHAKQHRQRMHQELLTHSILESVRMADVLLVNPTHLAIALKYDREGEEGAPEVTAKGQDDLAQRMIQAAYEAGVPVMRDISLAHALYQLEVGEEIPEALYEAVALVLQAAWQTHEEDGGGER